MVDTDDPISSYLLSGWGRICAVLGTDFYPYLNTVMPPLLKSAQVKPDVALLDVDAPEGGDDYPEDEGWEFVVVDGRKFGIKTSMLDDKCTAMEMLLVYARVMEAHFAPFVEPVLNLSLSLFTFYYSEGVRQAAVSLIPYLLKDALLAGFDPEAVRQIWATVLLKINAALYEEASVEFIQYLYNALGEGIAVMGDGCMSAEQLDDLGKSVEISLSEYFQRYQKRQRSRVLDQEEGEEEDEAPLDEEQEADDEMLNQITRALHAAVKHHRSTFLQMYETRLTPYLSTFLVFFLLSSMVGN